MASTDAVQVLSLYQRWKVDPSHGKRAKVVRPLPTVSSPPGYSATAIQNAESDSSTEAKHLAAKRTWEIALGPLKQVPMNLFIMYMAGNSMSMFPIMMVGMMLIRPLKALLAVNAAFRSVEKDNLIGEKCVFIIGNIVGILLALYKCSSMGLLPTHSSDWLAFAESPRRIEFSVGGFSYNYE